MEKTGPIRPFGVTLVDPPTEILGVDGLVTATVHLTNVAEIAAAIYPTTASNVPVAVPPDHAVFASLQTTEVQIVLNRIPGANAPTGAVSSNDNKLYLWTRPSTSTANWDRTSHGPFPFRRPATGTIHVSAKACIFFAYAPLGYAGPVAESGDAYRPYALVIPSNSNSVRLTASGTWRHNPADFYASGPDGNANEGNASNDARYKSNAYKSNGINLTSAYKFNRLIALAETGYALPSGANQIDIGPSKTENVAGLSRLFLAHHDSHEWDNNSQEVSVYVEWL